MAQEFKVAVDLTQLIQMDAFARVGLFANLSARVEELAHEGVSRWQRAVAQAPGIWAGERTLYSASIQARKVGPYAWEVFSDYKYVEDIERGRPPYDLKKMLDTSMKVRVSKKGRRYLIIPFRHNTPGNTAHAPAMSDDVYAEAKELAPSRITGKGSRASGTGAFGVTSHKPVRVTTRKYAWGGRLDAGLTPKLKPEHKADPTAGMVRMKNASGGSKYMTFRVMVEGSPGWVIPARPGLFLAKAVAESLQKSADLELPAAVAKDLAAA